MRSKARHLRVVEKVREVGSRGEAERHDVGRHAAELVLCEGALLVAAQAAVGCPASAELHVQDGPHGGEDVVTGAPVTKLVEAHAHVLEPQVGDGSPEMFGELDVGERPEACTYPAVGPR